MSIMVFSWRSRAAPSLMMRSAAASSIRPSKMKCCLRTSGRGLPVFVSNTSATDNLRLGGNGTPANKSNMINIRFRVGNASVIIHSNAKSFRFLLSLLCAETRTQFAWDASVGGVCVCEKSGICFVLTSDNNKTSQEEEEEDDPTGKTFRGPIH